MSGNLTRSSARTPNPAQPCRLGRRYDAQWNCASAQPALSCPLPPPASPTLSVSRCPPVTSVDRCWAACRPCMTPVLATTFPSASTLKVTEPLVPAASSTPTSVPNVVQPAGTSYAMVLIELVPRPLAYGLPAMLNPPPLTFWSRSTSCQPLTDDTHGRSLR